MKVREALQLRGHWIDCCLPRRRRCRLSGESRLLVRDGLRVRSLLVGGRLLLRPLLAWWATAATPTMPTPLRRNMSSLLSTRVG